MLASVCVRCMGVGVRGSVSVEPWNISLTRSLQTAAGPQDQGPLSPALLWGHLPILSI